MRRSGYIAAVFLALACIFTLATHAAFAHAVPDARTRHKLTRPVIAKTALVPVRLRIVSLERPAGSRQAGLTIPPAVANPAV
jgi:hypothetical protein